LEELASVLDRALELGASYADVRVTRSFRTRMTVVNGKIERVVPSIDLSVGIRVLYQGVWGFSTCNSTSKDDLLEAISNAVKIAKAGSSMGAGRIQLAEVEAVKDRVELEVISDSREVPLEDKQEIILESDRIARELDPRIVRTQFDYEDSVVERHIFSTEGCQIYETNPFTSLRFTITAREADRIERTIGRLAASAGQELLAYADPMEMAQGLAMEALDLLKAKHPPSGRMPVIVDNKIAGLIALCVDLMATATLASVPESEMGVFYGKVGEQILPEALDITDDPTSPGLPASYKYDEEGIESRPMKIIEAGVLKGYLHSRETAYKHGTNPTGHARAPSASFLPVPMVSNAIIDPRDHTFEELVEGIDKGIYLKGIVGATIGRFVQCKTMIAQTIENGEIKDEVLKGPSLRLDLLKDLFSIDAVGSDYDYLPLRLTRADEAYSVSGGGPHLRFSQLEVI